MMCRYLTLLLVPLLSGALGEEVPCLTTKSSCTQTMAYSALYVDGSDYHCCTAGYAMRWDDETCLCNKTSEVVACEEGEDTCSNVTAIVSSANADDVNVTRCCQADYTMVFFTGYFNNASIVSCMCSRSLGGGYQLLQIRGSRISYSNYHGSPTVDISSFIEQISSDGDD